MLVSGENIDPANLSVLFRAVERETDVTLEGAYDVDTLLEDLALRFAKSRHLDSEQKNKYSAEIRRISQEIVASTQTPTPKPIPRAYAKILEDLKQALSSSDLGKATELTKELEERLVSRESDAGVPNIFRVYGRLYQRSPVTFFVTLVLSVALYAYLLQHFLKILHK